MDVVELTQNHHRYASAKVGEVVAVNDTILHSPFETTIKRVGRLGVRVKKGARLILLDDGVVRHQLAGAEKELEALQDRKKLINEQLRQSKNDKSLMISARSGAMADFENTLSEIQLEIVRVITEVVALENKLKKAEILAPFDGVIAEIHVGYGQSVDKGDPLVRFIDDQEVEAVFHLNKRDRWIRGSQSLIIDMPDKSVAIRTVDRVVMASERKNKMQAIVKLGQTEGWVVGEEIKAYASRKDLKEFLVPESSLLFEDGKFFLLMVNESGMEKSSEVELKGVLGDWVVIYSALLKDGQKYMKEPELGSAPGTIKKQVR